MNSRSNKQSNLFTTTLIIILTLLPVLYMGMDYRWIVAAGVFVVVLLLVRELIISGNDGSGTDSL